MNFRLALFLSLFVTLSLNGYAQRITKAEKAMILGSDRNTKMHVTQVTNEGDLFILRANSAPIKNPRAKIWDVLIDRMMVTVQHPDHKGVGIAAPQVGINRQMFLMQRFDKQGQPFEAVFNPVILAFSDSLHSRNEGCLSIPGIRDTVIRPWAITVKYENPKGELVQETIEDFTARIFQHEYDHLIGVLFTDKSNQQKQNNLFRTIK